MREQEQEAEEIKKRMEELEKAKQEAIALQSTQDTQGMSEEALKDKEIMQLQLA